jgi:C2 domain
VVHKTETIRDNLNPVWRPFSLDLMRLCHGNIHAPILVEVYDYDSSGHHDLIGRATTSVNDLKIMKEVRLIHPKKKGRMLYRDSGTLIVRSGGTMSERVCCVVCICVCYKTKCSLQSVQVFALLTCVWCMMCDFDVCAYPCVMYTHTHTHTLSLSLSLYLSQCLKAQPKVGGAAPGGAYGAPAAGSYGAPAPGAYGPPGGY